MVLLLAVVSNYAETIYCTMVYLSAMRPSACIAFSLKIVGR